MTSNERCLSELRLDELLAGELSPDEQDLADAHLGGCGRCRDRLTAIERDRDAYRAHPPALPHRPLPRWWVGTGAAVALAAALALVLLPREPGGERTKGADRLGFFVKSGTATRPGAQGEQVHPGDVLIFTLTNAKPAYLAILSRDGAGRTSVYYPDGPTAERRAAGRDVELPLAALLDDTLGPERITALLCAAPVELEPLRRTLEATGELTAPPDCTLHLVTIEKIR